LFDSISKDFANGFKSLANDNIRSTKSLVHSTASTVINRTSTSTNNGTKVVLRYVLTNTIKNTLSTRSEIDNVLVKTIYLTSTPLLVLSTLAQNYYKFYRTSKTLTFVFSDKTIVYRFKRTKNTFEVTLKSLVCLDEIVKNTNRLEHFFNASLTNIDQSLQNRRIIKLTFEKGKSSDYRDLKRTSWERLNKILVELGDTPKYISTIKSSVELVHKFSTKLSTDKLNKKLEDIENKLGCNIGTLSLERQFDVIECIINTDTKQYYLDDLIYTVPRNNRF